MKAAAKKLMEEVQKKIKEPEFQESHVRNREKDFKRKRKMGFADTILYTIGNTKGPLEIEAEKFKKYINCEKISGAAICKARKKIKYTAYQELFESSAEQVAREKNYHGYQLIAIDGMKGELPKTKELTEKYAKSSGQGRGGFHAITAYDVQNEIFIKSEVYFGTANERTGAERLIERLVESEKYKEKKQILIFDRGYPSLELINQLEEKGIKYVMRVSSSFVKEVNNFRKSKYVDRVVEVEYKAKEKGQSREKRQLKIRCVRIKLSCGEEEILLTNLERKEFAKREIKEIYQKRWEIEKGFNNLKHAIYLEEFGSKTEDGILQEYYSTLLLSNFITCLCGPINKKKEIKKENGIIR